jgi:hypothetical protein
VQWSPTIAVNDEFEFNYTRKSTDDLVVTLYDVTQKEAVAQCTLSFVEVAQAKGSLVRELLPLRNSHVCPALL